MSKAIHILPLWAFMANFGVNIYLTEQTLISKTFSAINFLLLDIQNCCYRCWKQHTPEYIEFPIWHTSGNAEVNGQWWVSQECYIYHFWAKQPVLWYSMGKSSEVSHCCESELNAFPTQMFKNSKSFVIFGSAIQSRCDKHLYLSADYQHVRGQQKSHRGTCASSFLWPSVGQNTCTEVP
jgi:hypothetical protein